MTTPRPIRLLPEGLRNRINAGEVVDRPAGVVKELVENSIDASAARIEAAIERGGLSRIVVQDNGHGVPADQLELAVTRHATSKIATDDDLFAVSSLGFRGEALPSVAAVSRLSVQSRTADDADSGWRIESAFGETAGAGPAAMNPGTRVEVRDLFANVPARLKFLKTEQYEARRCREAVIRLSLAHPELSFQWSVDGKALFDLPPGQSLAERLAVFWPESICEALIPVDHEQAGVRVRGLAGSPSTAQARGDRILAYVRGRPVSDKLLAGAVRAAYKGRLISREHPQAVLFVDLDPAEVDVNVHPAKLEVRFRREDAVFSAVRTALVRALDTSQSLGGPSTPVEILAPPERPAFQPYQQLLDTSPRPPDTAGRTRPDTRPDAWPASPSTDHPAFGYEPSGDPQAPPAPDWPAQDPSRPYWERDPDLPPAGPGPSPAVHDASPAYNGDVLAGRGLEYLGQIVDAYLVLRDASGELLLVDQHAAHERVLFEARRRAACKAPARPLAMPVSLSLHPSEAERLQALWPDLKDLGFELEMRGAAELAMNACPGELQAGEAKDYLRSVAAGQADSLEDLWVLMSCRSAVKAGDRLARGEALSLLESWLQTDNREHCPHGRPTVVKFGERDLAKLFKRTG